MLNKWNSNHWKWHFQSTLHPFLPLICNMFYFLSSICLYGTIRYFCPDYTTTTFCMKKEFKIENFCHQQNFQKQNLPINFEQFSNIFFCIISAFKHLLHVDGIINILIFKICETIIKISCVKHIVFPAVCVFFTLPHNRLSKKRETSLA